MANSTKDFILMIKNMAMESSIGQMAKGMKVGGLKESSMDMEY